MLMCNTNNPRVDGDPNILIGIAKQHPTSVICNTGGHKKTPPFLMRSFYYEPRNYKPNANMSELSKPHSIAIPLLKDLILPFKVNRRYKVQVPKPPNVQ